MRTVRAVILAWSYLIVSANCMADSPRLFLVQKGSHSAFFLPLMHTPSAIEKDPYLSTVIEEVFRRSTILYDESSGVVNIYHSAITPCSSPVPLPAGSQKKLDDMYYEVTRHDIFKFPVPGILKEMDFAKIMIILFGPVIPDLANLPRGYIASEPQVSDALAIKYRIEKQSIESMSDLHTAYCGLALHDKIRMVEALFEDHERDFLFEHEPARSNFYNRLLRCIRASLTDVSACLQFPPVEARHVEFDGRDDLGHSKFILTERNRMWISKIKEHSKGSGVPFYAFGAAHFLPNVGGPGLFTQLQREGFTVKLVRSLSDVPRHIMELAPRTDMPSDEDMICRVP